MSKEEIRKLIGGYATGSLTDDERRQLFDAALDDQELFDQLQEEQSLKELLDDPISREQIRRAAAESLPPSWFRRPWIWAVGASFATAAVLLVALVQWVPKAGPAKQFAVVRKEALQTPETPGITKVEPPMKAVRPPAKPMAAKKEQRLSALEVPAGPPLGSAPSQPPPVPEQTQSVPKDAVLEPPPPVPLQESQHQQQVPGQQAQDRTGQAVEPRRPVELYRSRAIAGSSASLAPQFALPNAGSHSFMRRLEDGSYVNVPAGAVFHPGDTIRLTITPSVSGPLVVSEWDAKTSSWNRLFPREGEQVQVRALQRFTVPIDIVVKSGERLQLNLVSGNTEIPVDVR